MTLLFATASGAIGLPKLGTVLPNHPWTQKKPYIVVLYSHDCGDMGSLWQQLTGFPIQAVNAEDISTPAPVANVWRGEGATRFSRAIKVRTYPTLIYVENEKITRFWDPDTAVGLETFLKPLGGQ